MKPKPTVVDERRPQPWTAGSSSRVSRRHVSLLVNGRPREAWGREAAGRATRDAGARGKDAGVARRDRTRATRARSAGSGLDSRLARAYLRVLLGRPLFFFYRRVDLVAPPLRALLAGLPGELRGDERPSVAVNFLETAGRKDGASASRELASDASVAGRAFARAGDASNNCCAQCYRRRKQDEAGQSAASGGDAPATARVPRLPRRSTPMSSCHRSPCARS